MKETTEIYSKVSRTIQKGVEKKGININGKGGKKGKKKKGKEREEKKKKACVGVAGDVGVCSRSGARGGAALSGNNGVAPQASLQLQVLQLLPQFLSLFFLLFLPLAIGLVGGSEFIKQSAVHFHEGFQDVVH